MKTLIDLQKKLFPDLLDIIQRRYHILKYIRLLEPVGRRTLAESTGYPERSVRSEIDFFHEEGLIEVTTKGMNVTQGGKDILLELQEFMNEFVGLSVLEKQLKEALSLEHVIVVSGNSDDTEWVKQEMGKACVGFIKGLVTSGKTISVTGGSTMAAVSEMMTPFHEAEKCLFVPARGGLGEHVENQANTICVEMAKKAQGEYRLLYVPDQLSEESYQMMIQEPSIKEILQLIQQADIIVHGIGNAMIMAERRKTPERDFEKIREKHAVSEAFGYYFDKNGEVIHKVRTVGLQLEDLTQANSVIAVAGGKSKAEAIASYFKQGQSNVLITDEGAALELVKGLSPIT